MKSIVTALALGMFLVAAPAFGKSFDTLDVNVPSGWTEEPQQGGVVLVAPDGVSMIALSAGSAEGRTAQDLAASTSQAFKGTKPVAEGKGYLFTCTPDPSVGEAKIFITVAKDTALLAVMQGDHPDLLKIAKSAKPK